jgi:hypothetical protein
MAEKTKEPLGKARQIRFPKEVEQGLQEIADHTGLEWVDAVRLASRYGLPILKKRLGASVKAAA